MQPIFEALSLLTPFDISLPKCRIGPQTDGGYVLADHFSPEQTVLSYGISTEYRFDRSMAESGHTVYMFDHTIDGIEDPHHNMHWYREGIAGTSRPEQLLFTLQDHLERFEIQGDRLILKMDIEGDEFDALGNTSDETLSRFEQIGLELHYLGRLSDPTFRDSCVRLLKKINRQFTLFHVHANNSDGPNAIHMVNGLPTWNVLELSYIKTSAVTRSASKTLYPTRFDYPNTPFREKMLWFFPFLPTDCSLEAFEACDERAERQAFWLPF